MGHRGIGVAFGPADVPGPTSKFAEQAQALGVLVDEVVEAEMAVGIAMARRIRAIERAAQVQRGHGERSALGHSDCVLARYGATGICQ